MTRGVVSAGFFGKKDKKIGGDIGYFGLADWWLTTFTEEECRYMESVYQTMGAGIGGKRPVTLTTGVLQETSQSACSYLGTFAEWFTKPDVLHLADRIFIQAEQVSGDTLDRHFLYMQMIQAYYPNRDRVPGSLDKAIVACEKQIAMAPQAAAAFRRWDSDPNLPAHTGYKQLAIIRDKQGEYSEAIRLCKEAKRRKWNGDWDKRIARYQKKLDKAK